MKSIHAIRDVPADNRRAHFSLTTILLAVLSLLQVTCVHSFSTRLSWDIQTRHPHQSHGHIQPLSCPSRRQPLRLQNSVSCLDLEDSEIDRLSRIHTVVEKLRVQIPSLLSTPLTDASSKAVYDEEVTLVVDDIVLASSREELQSLSTTLVLAVAATNQANSLIANAVGLAGGASESNPQSASTLESDMAMDPTSTAIRVQWNATLPRQSTGQKQQLKGVTELELDPLTGKVTTLRLLRVQFNQEDLNARAIGESLSSLRQLVFAFQNSPFIPKSGLPSLSSLLGTDIIQQISAQQPAGVTTKSPLFVTDSLQTAFAGHNVTTSNSTNYTTTLVPIDDFRSNATLPLPGSLGWIKYVAARQVFATFRQSTLRVLSGNLSVASPEMLELFSPQAVLKTTDGSELLRGRDPVGNFFHTLASFRKRSSGTWELANATMLSYDDDQVTIAVDYRDTESVPGAGDVVIEGTDFFVVESAVLNLEGGDEREEGDDDVEILIKQIEQRKLRIKGRGVGDRSPDGLLFMKSLAALDAGRLSSVGADSVMMDLLQRVIAGENGRSEVAQKRKRRRTPPKLSDTVAARVYTIMSTLHHDVPTLFEKEMLRTYQLPPLHEYMSKDVELRGYLGETLARGLSSYNSALGTTFSSLKGALATGGAKLEQDPFVVVELTAEGNIRLRLSVDLKVLPLPSGAGELINSMSGSAISLPSGGFPLKFAIVSDYVLDKDTGEIYQHRVVETRINDQLTPGDVISRWIQKQVSMNPSSNSGATATDGARGLMDAISWVRSVSGRG